MNILHRIFSEHNDSGVVLVCRWIVTVLLFLACSFVFMRLSLALGLVPVESDVDDFATALGIISWYLVLGPFFVIGAMTIVWEIVSRLVYGAGNET